MKQFKTVISSARKPYFQNIENGETSLDLPQEENDREKKPIISTLYTDLVFKKEDYMLFEEFCAQFFTENPHGKVENTDFYRAFGDLSPEFLSKYIKDATDKGKKEKLDTFIEDIKTMFLSEVPATDFELVIRPIINKYADCFENMPPNFLKLLLLNYGYNLFLMKTEPSHLKTERKDQDRSALSKYEISSIRNFFEVLLTHIFLIQEGQLKSISIEDFLDLYFGIDQPTWQKQLDNFKTSLSNTKEGLYDWKNYKKRDPKSNFLRLFYAYYVELDCLKKILAGAEKVE